MVWVYDNTHSGPVAQLMHFSYTGSLALFVPLTAISHIQDALVYALLMVLLWLFVDITGASPSAVRAFGMAVLPPPMWVCQVCPKRRGVSLRCCTEAANPSAATITATSAAATPGVAIEVPLMTL